MGASGASWFRGSFWGRLPVRARVAFFSGVFFFFAPLGILVISSFAQKRPWYTLAVYMVFSGLTAAGFAYSFAQNRKFLWVVAPSQVLWFFLPRLLPGMSGALSVEGVGSVLFIVIGYVLFVRFIAGEGIRRFRLETEMRLAQQIHESLIPPVQRRTSRLELFGKSLASSEMGGDLLDVVESGDRVDVCIADVSGHGVRAGVVMGMVKSAMRMKFRQPHTLEELLDDLNQVVCDLAGSGMFVTCAFMRFESDSKVLFAGAGHGPVLQRIGADGTLRTLESEQLPLGVSANERYQTRSVETTAGDLFLLMTDGLTEVFDGSDRLLGQGPIEALFADSAKKSLPEMHAAIMSAVDRHGPRSDDQTLMLIRVLPRGPDAAHS